MSVSMLIALVAVLSFIAGLLVAGMIEHDLRKSAQTTITVQARMISDLLTEQNERREQDLVLDRNQASDRAMDQHLRVYGWAGADYAAHVLGDKVETSDMMGTTFPPVQPKLECVCAPPGWEKPEHHSNGCPEYVPPLAGYVGIKADEL